MLFLCFDNDIHFLGADSAWNDCSINRTSFAGKFFERLRIITSNKRNNINGNRVRKIQFVWSYLHICDVDLFAVIANIFHSFPIFSFRAHFSLLICKLREFIARKVRHFLNDAKCNDSDDLLIDLFKIKKTVAFSVQCIFRDCLSCLLFSCYWFRWVQIIT